MALDGFVHGGAVAPHLQCGLPSGAGARLHHQRVFLWAHVAQGIVQQVHQHAAQVLGVELHLHHRGFQRHLPAPPRRVLAAPVAPHLCHAGIQRQGGTWRMVDLVLYPGDVQHLLGDAGQAVGILLHHLRQPLLARVLQVFLQQGVGLDDGCQGVANLMRHGRRHAAHGRQLFGAQPGFHLAQVVQKHHAHPFGAAVLIAGGGGEPGAHMQAHGAFARMEKGHVGSLGLLFVEGAVGQCDQRLPASTVSQRKGKRRVLPIPQQSLCSGVGHAHGILLVHHQHTIVQMFDHQGADLRLHLRLHAAALGHFLLAHQPGRELVHQIAHHKVACAGEGTLQVTLRVVA